MKFSYHGHWDKVNVNLFIFEHHIISKLRLPPLALLFLNQYCMLKHDLLLEGNGHFLVSNTTFSMLCMKEKVLKEMHQNVAM